MESYLRDRLAKCWRNGCNNTRFYYSKTSKLCYCFECSLILYNNHKLVKLSSKDDVGKAIDKTRDWINFIGSIIDQIRSIEILADLKNIICSFEDEFSTIEESHKAAAEKDDVVKCTLILETLLDLSQRLNASEIMTVFYNNKGKQDADRLDDFKDQNYKDTI